jgi:hypothetical protein
VVSKIAKKVRLDLVFLGFLVVSVPSSGTVTPRSFDDLTLAEKVGALDRISFVGGPENYPIAEIQGKHFGFVIAQGHIVSRWRSIGIG